jgi:hypothetical protein
VLPLAAHSARLTCLSRVVGICFGLVGVWTDLVQEKGHNVDDESVSWRVPVGSQPLSPLVDAIRRPLHANTPPLGADAESKPPVPFHDPKLDPEQRNESRNLEIGSEPDFELLAMLLSRMNREQEKARRNYRTPEFRLLFSVLTLLGGITEATLQSICHSDAYLHMFLRVLWVDAVSALSGIPKYKSLIESGKSDTPLLVCKNSHLFLSFFLFSLLMITHLASFFFFQELDWATPGIFREFQPKRQLEEQTPAERLLLCRCFQIVKFV